MGANTKLTQTIYFYVMFYQCLLQMYQHIHSLGHAPTSKNISLSTVLHQLYQFMSPNVLISFSIWSFPTRRTQLPIKFIGQSYVLMGDPGTKLALNETMFFGKGISTIGTIEWGCFIVLVLQSTLHNWKLTIRMVTLQLISLISIIGLPQAGRTAGRIISGVALEAAAFGSCTAHQCQRGSLFFAGGTSGIETWSIALCYPEGTTYYYITIKTRDFSIKTQMKTRA